VPVGGIYNGSLISKPVSPLGQVMRNTILPPHKRDQGQSIKSDIHRLAEQLSQLKVVGRGRAYRVD